MIWRSVTPVAPLHWLCWYFYSPRMIWSASLCISIKATPAEWNIIQINVKTVLGLCHCVREMMTSGSKNQQSITKQPTSECDEIKLGLIYLLFDIKICFLYMWQYGCWSSKKVGVLLSDSNRILEVFQRNFQVFLDKKNPEDTNQFLLPRYSMQANTSREFPKKSLLNWRCKTVSLHSWNLSHGKPKNTVWSLKWE